MKRGAHARKRSSIFARTASVEATLSTSATLAGSSKKSCAATDPLRLQADNHLPRVVINLIGGCENNQRCRVLQMLIAVATLS